jgi:RNA polymerase sigma factor (sigma-70 family)
VQVVSHEAWEWLIANETAVNGLIRKSCRGAYHLQDELLEEVYDRVVRVYETHDPRFDVPVTPYVMRSLRWYLWKWMNKNYLQLSTQPLPEDKPAPDELGKLEHIDEVQYILSRLDRHDRHLLALKHLAGMTFEQMGEALGVTKVTARKHYLRALREARRVTQRGDGQ